MMPLDPIRAVFSANLGVKKSERVLVFTDRPAKTEGLGAEDSLRRERLREIANMTADVGRALAGEVAYVEYPAGGGHGKEPPAKLWRAAFGEGAVEELKRDGILEPLRRKKASREKMARAERIVQKHKGRAVDAVVALSHYSTTHTTFRDLLTRVAGARYASMPLFDFAMLEGPMNVDWKALAKRSRAVARAASGAVEIEITAPNGTRLVLGAAGRKVHADTGALTKPGSFGNLPAGEAFLAPVEGTARGTLVLEWSPSGRLIAPVILTVSEGLVQEVAGTDPYASALRAKLAERKENRNIAELGIGTNERATRPDNVLEAEKIMGTVHIALGDNSTFGGRVKAPFHQDFVFFRPTVILKGKTGAKSALLKDGKLII